MWLLYAAVAHAGFAGGVMGLVQVPLVDPTSSTVSPGAALYAGWRQDVGLLHLQPEVVVRTTVPNGAFFVGPGAAVTFGSPLAIGVYAHVGFPEYLGWAWDAGAILEVTALPKLRPALRVGYDQPHQSHEKCGACPQPSDHMVDVALVLGFAL